MLAVYFHLHFVELWGNRGWNKNWASLNVWFRVGPEADCFANCIRDDLHLGMTVILPHHAALYDFSFPWIWLQLHQRSAGPREHGQKLVLEWSKLCHMIYGRKIRLLCIICVILAIFKSMFYPTRRYNDILYDVLKMAVHVLFFICRSCPTHLWPLLSTVIKVSNHYLQYQARGRVHHAQVTSPSLTKQPPNMHVVCGRIQQHPRRLQPSWRFEPWTFLLGGSSANYCTTAPGWN